MIEQQYYTKKKGDGLSQTEDYDTVAKSPLLKLEYIKKYLHPLCYYDMPIPLQEGQGIETTQYPPMFIIKRVETGELIVGQAVYKNEAFFMHNYVLSTREKRRYIKEPEKLFGITGFKDHFNNLESKELPTLAALPYDAQQPLFLDRALLLKELKLEEEIFCDLVGAAFIIAYSTRKLRIILDVPRVALDLYAKALSYHIYQALPWCVREQLSVCTYSGKLEAKEDIKIVFLDPKVLSGENTITQDFIFDLVHHQCINSDIHIKAHLYFQVILRYIGNKPAWEQYNKFVDQLAVLEKEAALTIAFFDHIALLFEMYLSLKSQKYYDLSDQALRKGVLEQLWTYCEAKLAEDTQRKMFELIEYTISLLQELLYKGILWSEDELKVLFAYKLKYKRDNKEHFLHCKQIVLCLLTEAIKQEKAVYIEAVLKEIVQYPEFYKKLYEDFYQDALLKRELVYKQITKTLEGVKDFSQFSKQLERYTAIDYILMEEDYYKEAVLKCFNEILENHLDKVKLLKDVQDWCQCHEGDLYLEIRICCEQYFLSHVQLEKDILLEEVLCGLKFLQSYPDETYTLITTYQALKTDIRMMSPDKIQLNKGVQELIKVFYKRDPTREDFYMLVYAFLEITEQLATPKLQVTELLVYLAEVDKELMFTFIVWGKGQELYMERDKFDMQVIDFFIQKKEQGQKISNTLIKKQLGSHVKTKTLAQKIIVAQRPALLQIFSKHPI